MKNTSYNIEPTLRRRMCQNISKEKYFNKVQGPESCENIWLVAVGDAVLVFCTGLGCQEGSVIEHFQEIIHDYSQLSFSLTRWVLPGNDLSMFSSSAVLFSDLYICLLVIRWHFHFVFPPGNIFNQLHILGHHYPAWTCFERVMSCLEYTSSIL